MTVQLNSDFSHASVVPVTAAPSGSSFTATDAAEKSEFCFNTPMTFEEYEISVTPIMWRISIQILATQVQDYKIANEEDKESWKQRMLNSLIQINKYAQMFRPKEFAFIPVPHSAYSAQNVTGNWCYTLTQELAEIFMSAPSVGI